MVSDVDVTSLGKVGDVTEVLVLHPIEPCSKYAMCPLDFDIMTHVFDIMPKAVNFLLRKYCLYCIGRYTTSILRMCILFYFHIDG